VVADLGGSRRRDDETLLATLGVDLAAVRRSVEASFGLGAIDRLYARRRRDWQRLTRGPLCGVTMPRLKKALEAARRAARTEHRLQATSTDLLLGLLAVADGMAVRLLRCMDVDPAELRTQLSPRAAS
jgi:ATP-dependent Clp protease ATP-binding subunit ClpA